MDAGLAEIMPGRNARFAGKQRIGLKERVRKCGLIRAGGRKECMDLVHRVLLAKGEEYAEELRCPSTVLRPPRSSSRAEVMPGGSSGEVRLASARK
ncbi:hypothetical protein Y696_11060 [Mesotoga sp. H07pep.5.4]|nr:hypothetical protein Y696_11060 [Mesotoga sp. H07pep.5.4]